MKILLSKSLFLGARAGHLKAKDLISFLITKEGFTLPQGKTPDNTPLKEISFRGRAVQKCGVDIHTGEIELSFS